MPEKSFIRRLETQLADFPNNKHDDIIDCLAQALKVLDEK
jgi:phage terminase large subunit-like protein